MRTTHALALAAMAVNAIACAGTARDPSKPDADDAVVRVRTAVKDASLWVDGRFIGPIGGLRGGVALEPGKHRFELRHDEYFSHYEELDLAPRQEVQLDVEMAPILP
ncbi:MAG TPA: hypothetical protein VM261_23195 [Kofleriaceae bacterium]|nr:hypothetical protein [Kofleriaceae bacterium]